MSRNPANFPNRNISRIELRAIEGKSQIKGWEVRVSRRDQRFNQFFSDKLYGGKTKALKAARAVRDIMVEKIKPLTRKELSTRMTSRNTSGHRGVRMRTCRITNGKKNYIYQHIEASWTTDAGEVVKKAFSVQKLGLEKAWKMAIACRMKGVKGLS